MTQTLKSADGTEYVLVPRKMTEHMQEACGYFIQPEYWDETIKASSKFVWPSAEDIRQEAFKYGIAWEVFEHGVQWLMQRIGRE